MAVSLPSAGICAGGSAAVTLSAAFDGAVSTAAVASPVSGSANSASARAATVALPVKSASDAVSSGCVSFTSLASSITASVALVSSKRFAATVSTDASPVISTV